MLGDLSILPACIIYSVALYQICINYYIFEFSSSVHDITGFEMVFNIDRMHGWMLSLCFPCSCGSKVILLNHLLWSWQQLVESVCREMKLRKFWMKHCLIFKMVSLWWWFYCNWRSIQEATAIEKSENEDSNCGQDSICLHGVASVTNIFMGIHV